MEGVGMTLVEVVMASVEVVEVEEVALAKAEDMDAAVATHLVVVTLEEVDMIEVSMAIHFQRSTS